MSLAPSQISSSERQFIKEGFEVDVREDGRSKMEYRPYSIELSPLDLSNGSSRIFLPNRSTDIICSIKAEIVAPTIAQPHRGIVEVSVKFLNGLPEAKSRQRSNEMEATQLLNTLISESMPLEQLIIVPQRYCWKLSVDLLVMSSNGNLLDVCSMAIYSALNVTYLPAVNVVEVSSSDNTLVQFDNMARQDDTGKNPNTPSMKRRRGRRKDDELLVDRDTLKAKVPPCAKQCPIIVTVSHTGQHNNFVLDATQQEEMCTSSKILVSIDKDGKIGGLKKIGQGSLPFQELQTLAESASSVAQMLYRDKL